MGRLDSLRDLARNGETDEALRQLRALERERDLSPPELVFKGLAILLASDEYPQRPEDARRAFEAALQVDENYVPALIELGSFLYALEDDAATALLLFEKAIELSLNQFKEAVEGKAKCLTELLSADEARQFLRQTSRDCFDITSLEEKLED